MASVANVSSSSQEARRTIGYQTNPAYITKLSSSKASEFWRNLNRWELTLRLGMC